MFFWMRPDGSLANTGATQYHPGHWFDANDNAVNWGDGSRVWVRSGKRLPASLTLRCA